MNRRIKTIAASVLVTGMVVLTPAIAAESLPPEVTQGTVRYVSGGIGEAAVNAFKTAAPKYPLELLFAQKASPYDVYLADVKVVVRDAAGKVLLDTVSGGPFLLAHLPPGKYRIEADNEGVVKQQAVEVQAGKHRRVVFVWDVPGG